MKTTRVFLFGLAIIAAAMIFIRLVFPSQSPNPSSATNEPPQISVTPQSSPRRVAGLIINGRELKVEVATTAAEIGRGLSGRDTLDLDGMLFVFPTVEKQNFWMKDMRFPIDLLWINDGRVIDILRNIPTSEPGTPDSELKTYASPGIVSHVLELPAGAASQLGIEISSEIITTDPTL